MLTEERRRYILERLLRDGKVLSSELSESLNLSEDTIRRDLREMSAAGTLQRVHGGALPRTPTPLAFAARNGKSEPGKQCIADVASKLVRDGDLIAFDGGTTTLLVAQSLRPDLKATVVTNSLPIMSALAHRREIEVVMVGGILSKILLNAVGAGTVDCLRSIRADICFMGVAGIHVEAGLTTLDYEDAQVKAAMIAGAIRVVVVASAEKIGTSGPFAFSTIVPVTDLVTEASVPAEKLESFREAGINVLC